MNEVQVAFQARVQPWLLACFGETIAADREERNHRFLEEALELVQACGCTAGEAHQLVDYVFGRDVGEPAQEVGGVMVTLAALCLANGLDMHANAETELARIWTKVEAIRAKQAAKPKHSPLPQHVEHIPASGEVRSRIEAVANGADVSDVYGKEWCFEPAAQMRSDLRAILSLAPATQQGAAPAAGEVDVPDEDWLTDVIDDSLDQDWTGRVGAKAIIAAWDKRHEC